jgi:hypothetical protein
MVILNYFCGPRNWQIETVRLMRANTSQPLVLVLGQLQKIHMIGPAYETI